MSVSSILNILNELNKIIDLICEHLVRKILFYSTISVMSQYGCNILFITYPPKTQFKGQKIIILFIEGL
jgi:hypothetical protein